MTHYTMLKLSLLVSAAICVTPALADPAVPVRIDRDAMGVPHVFADTSAGVMYGAGYAEAQDRLAEMEMSRRRALGRTAEALGPSAVASDIVSRDRTLPAAELMRMYHEAPVEHQRMMQAFVDGVNAAIADIERDPAHLTPYEFTRWGVKPERWALLDYLAMIAGFPRGREGNELKNLAFMNAMVAKYGQKTGHDMFDDLVPVSDPDSPTAIPAGEDLAPARPNPVPTYLTLPGETAGTVHAALPAPGQDHSRCLVIGPKRTASGHVLMFEATADGPEIHLHGGGFNSTGFTSPAWGMPIMGRGPHHGWLVTSGQSDSTDYFAEKLNPADPYQYWYQGAWHKMERRQESIAVKGAPAVVHEVDQTVHGSVISWDKEHGVAYSARFAERGHEIDNWVGVVEMQRAQSLTEFEAKGIAKLSTDFGVCYGNERGDIGFWETGLQPIRATGADPRLPTPGTGEYEWQGFLSLNQRPHMVNPKQGYIHAWNSKPTTWSREGDEARIGATFRTWLGNRLGASAHNITLLDLEDYNRQIWNALGARDRTQTSPDFFAPYLRAAAEAAHDPEVTQAVALMTGWNGLYEDRDGDGYYDNPGLTLFRAWLEAAPQAIYSDKIGNWYKAIDEKRYLKYQTSFLLRTLQGQSAGLPVKVDYFNGQSRDAVVAETVRKAIAAARPHFAGKPMAEWRTPIYWKYLSKQPEDPARLPFPHDDESTPKLWSALGLGPKMLPSNGGEGWTGLMELGTSPPALYSVIEEGGQDQFIDPAGHGNPHLTDQAVMHAQDHFKRIAMDPEQVHREARTTITLQYHP